MNFAQIIAAIQASGIENAEVLTKALNEYADTVASDHKKTTDKLTNQIETLTSAIGIESGTTDEKLSAAKNAVATLTAERNTLKTDKEALEKTITANKKQDLIRSAAGVSKANAEVLSALITSEDIKIEDNKVTVDGKELHEWATERKSPFLSSLFPSPDPTNKLPGTPPHQQKEGKSDKSDEPEKKSVVDAYLSKTYKTAQP